MHTRTVNEAITAAQNTYPVKFSFRKSGKVHRGLRFEDGWQCCACRCPGSQNGTLIQGATIVAEGWEVANCGH